MKKISILLLLSLSLNAKTFTVSETGSLTVSEALVKCNTNDTILITTGTYSYTTIVNKSCKIIGIGDVIFDGKNRANGKICFNITANNVKISNIKIRNYTYGINIPSATGCYIQKVNTSCTGDTTNSYSGRGIQLGSYNVSSANSNTITNCIVYNSAAEGISVNGNGNYVSNCFVYCDENNGYAATDYYLNVNGNKNIIRGCVVKRVGNLSHCGHGIGVKGNCTGNIITLCIAYNMSESFYVRHRGAKFNDFSYCKGVNSNNGSYSVRDGASYNTFTSCSDSAGSSSVRFFDTVEDGGATYCGRHNTFNKCTFKNKYVGVFFDGYSVPSIADSNLIVNCVFANMNYLFRATRENRDNEMVFCTIKNVLNYYFGSTKLNFDYTNSTFINSKNQ